jgi:peptidoglycan/xylan/chitin deacetylase (PgdA/CDA1 family)
MSTSTDNPYNAGSCSPILVMALIVLIGFGLPAVHAETGDGDKDSVPRLVKIRPQDTPATLSRRYLQKEGNGWMILEYNDIETLSAGRPLVIPTAPFRPGGLAPDSYQTLPVLAYGALEQDPPAGLPTTLTTFRKQMDWLQHHGLRTIGPGPAIDFMAFRGQIPRQAVLLTFDTTSQAFYRFVFPILASRGASAILFLATDDIGTAGALNWDQVREMHAAGIAIGCRGGSGHSLLRRKKKQTFHAYFRWIESELLRSKKAIESHLQTDCTLLAYPEGEASDLVRAMAAKLGFKAAFTLTPGENPFFVDRFAVHRIPVGARTAPEALDKWVVTRIQVDLR